MARPRQVVRSNAPRYSVRTTARRRKKPQPPRPPPGPVAQVITALACLILSLIGAVFLAGAAAAFSLPAVGGYVVGLNVMGWGCVATTPGRLGRWLLIGGLVVALIAGLAVLLR